MKIIAPLAALLALFASAAPALAQQSSAADKQHLVAIVRNLEAAPMSATARNDRAWAIQWVTEAPDVTVNVCLDPLGKLTKEHYAHDAEIVVQYTLGMAAFIVEHPGANADAQQLAGVESALKSYQSMRTAAPNEKVSPALEDLLAKQGRGELPAFVHTAYASCMAKNGK